MIRTLELGDRAGIAVAAACALHCLAAPVLGTSLQIAGVLLSEGAELAFLSTSLLVSGTTVLATCLRRGGRAAVWATFLVGAALLVSARSGTAWAERLEPALVFGGAGLVAAAHVVNLRHCRCRTEERSCVTAV